MARLTRDVLRPPTIGPIFGAIGAIEPDDQAPEPGTHEREPGSVAMDAHHAVYGDRQDDYGHPRTNTDRTAVIWQALLGDKLAEGATITGADVARCMIGVKLSRDVNEPKRDNRVDIAGYAVVLDRLETGQ